MALEDVTGPLGCSGAVPLVLAGTRCPTAGPHPAVTPFSGLLHAASLDHLCSEKPISSADSLFHHARTLLQPQQPWDREKLTQMGNC